MNRQPYTDDPSMIDSFDVFAVRIDSEWLGCAETLPQALEMIRESGEGAYFVFSKATERNILYLLGPDGCLSLIEKQSETVQ
jgi:hypothetical protein